jgi:hypothetical protein
MDNRRVGAKRASVGVLHRIYAGSLSMMRVANEIVMQTVRVAQLIIIAALALVVYYAMDREPPFAVVSVIPASARAGEYITLEAVVRRDIDRKCSAEFSRYLFDAAGSRYDLGHSISSAEMIEQIQETYPNILRISLMLPPTMEVGLANMQTVLEYQCNKVHRIWPIIVTTDIPFTVLP